MTKAASNFRTSDDRCPDRSATPPTIKRVVAGGMIGTVVEFYDFVIYATISGLVFGKLFFVGGNEFLATIMVWATFAIGFLVRPVGGIIFGHLGDKIGRSRILFVTLTIMGVATTTIGFLPTYDEIGIAAPLVLVLLRIIQGLAVGGEYGGAVLMVIEHTDGSGRRGFFGALTSASASLGVLAASGTLALLTAATTDEQFSGWAWRIPFLVSSVLLGVGFYIRYRLNDTPAMQQAKESGDTARIPFLELLRTHPRNLLIATSVPFGMFAMYYIVISYSVPFAVNEGHLNESFVLTMSTIAQVVYLCAVSLGGYISDKFGRRYPIMAGAVGLALWSFAYFPLLRSGGAGTFAAFAGAMIFVGLIYGPLAAYLVELFSSKVRYSGISFGYQIAGALGGGLAPLAAAYLVAETGSGLAVAAVVAVVLMITTFVAAFVSREPANVDLRQ